jgi:sugar lactone lactonase YvrE
MRQAWRMIAGLLAVGAFAAGGSVALADNGNHGGKGNGNHGNRGAAATTVFTMPAATDGNPEGIAVDKRSGRFFVSRVGTGSIFQGTLGTPPPALTPFITADIAGTPPLATGMKVRRGLLYVAGASTGQIRVYDLAHPGATPKVFETGGGFINDLDLDRHGNVFATDSTQSKIFLVTAEQVAAGTGAPLAIDVSSGITSDTSPGAFNLNGIIVKRHNELIVVQSNTGQLFRITFAGDDHHHGDHHARAAQAAPAAKVKEIDLGGKKVTGGDGLLIDRGRLLVVRGTNGEDPPTAPGAPPNGSNGLIDVVKLSRHDTRGRVGTPVFDATFSGPSTIARLGKRLLVVNASFTAGPTNGTFTVSGIARNAVRHGGGHGGH